jgi:ureidoglycolate hydrolase
MLNVNPLSEQSFRPFGKVLRTPERPPDGSSEAHNYWDRELEWTGSTSVNYLAIKQRDLLLWQMERHRDTREMLVLLQGTCYLAVAPAGVLAADKIAVFELKPGDAICLDAGVWHDLPFSREDSAAFLVIYKDGTAQHDLELVPLPATEAIAGALSGAESNLLGA